MDLTFQLSKGDYLRFYKLSLKDSFYRQFRRFVVFAIALLVLFNIWNFVWWWCLCSLLIVPFIIAAIYYVVPLLIFSNKLNKWPASAFLKKSLALKDDGFHTESEGIVNVWKWDSMKSAYSNAEFVYIFMHDNKFIAIPQMSFKSPSDASNFYGTVLQKLNALGPHWMRQSAVVINKPNYWWGLLGIIPGVGAVAGAIITVNGISRYKDGKYIAMGVACMAFTVIVAYIANNKIGFERTFNRQFIANSHNELNNLMKNVEFYKLKHGEYPDSLEQLSKEEPTIFNFDPIQLSDNKYGTGYNYQKVNDHYYLFSSGLDGIPNTKDDFYPDIAAADSTKFGLIRK